ncbi:ZCHC3 protein, partial [Atractosteus spatula]|nr:ZCHC3 protein [Atractosteus spatula]
MVNDELLRDFDVLGLAQDDVRFIIVNMHDPFIEDDIITAYLWMHVDVLAGPQIIGDRFRVWNGRRRYQVRLRRNVGRADGFSHPPSAFFLGQSKGYIYYQNQPSYCRKCCSFGHMDKDCTATSCSRCGARDHTKGRCFQKTCSLCGDTNHLYREC